MGVGLQGWGRLLDGEYQDSHGTQVRWKGGVVETEEGVGIGIGLDCGVEVKKVSDSRLDALTNHWKSKVIKKGISRTES